MPTPDTTDDAGTGDQRQTGTSTETTTQAPAEENETGHAEPKTPPTAELTADVVNGTAPLNVTLTLDGSDADGDDLIWRLSVDGADVADGTDLPATYNHTFTETGNFSVVLGVSDGQADVQANTTIVVSQASPELVPDSYVGGFLAGGPYGCALVQTSYTEDDPQRGVLWDNYLINPETIGQEYTATISAEVPVAAEMFIYSEANDILARHSNDLGANGEYTGEIPDGAHWIFWRGCMDADVTVEFHTGV